MNSKQIQEILNEYLSHETKDISVIVEEVDSLFNTGISAIDRGLNPDSIEILGRSAIEIGANSYNSIGERTKNFLGGQIFEFDGPYKPKNTQVGKISYSYKSAFVDNLNPSATNLSVFFSLLIDFLVPLFILLTTKRTGNSEDPDSSPWPFKKKSKITPV